MAILDWPRGDPFGPRLHPISGDWRNHNGQDFPAASGTPIPAAADGVIHARGYGASAGNWVELRPDARTDVVLDHFHLVSSSGPVAGARVRAGDTIGYVGSTGDSTGPHLHLEVRVLASGERVEPIAVLEALQRGGGVSAVDVIAAYRGFQNASAVVEAAVATGLPLGIAVALVEQESTWDGVPGQNIYGHDLGGVFSTRALGRPAEGSPSDGLVTEANFSEFLRRINAGETSNGVGLTQITWKPHFPAAAEQGLALWKPLDNCVYGFRILAGYLGGDYSRASIEAAGIRYNGASSYGPKLADKADYWTAALAGASTNLTPLPTLTTPRTVTVLPLIIVNKIAGHANENLGVAIWPSGRVEGLPSYQQKDAWAWAGAHVYELTHDGHWEYLLGAVAAELAFNISSGASITDAAAQTVAERVAAVVPGLTAAAVLDRITGENALPEAAA